jgi:hypothetical protein
MPRSGTSQSVRLAASGERSPQSAGIRTRKSCSSVNGGLTTINPEPTRPPSAGRSDRQFAAQNIRYAQLF